jgi:diaminopimelate epimerase
MQTIIRFIKTSGAGNDFVLVNNMSKTLALDLSELSIALCSRHFGIGADGLLVLEPSKNADFLMKYYNSDGTYGGMCGNGGRCAARVAFVEGIAGERQRFEALDFVYNAHIADDRVRLQMKNPSSMLPLHIELGTTQVDGVSIDTGSPHFVVVANDIEKVDVAVLGRKLRHHNAFMPGGTNIDFIQLLGSSQVCQRTYERGVEAETLACGTGAVATAFAARHQFSIKGPIEIKTRGGESLVVDFIEEGGRLVSTTLEGSAHLLFVGEVVYDSSARRVVDFTARPGSPLMQAR